MKDQEIQKINEQLALVEWDNNFNLSFDHIATTNELLIDDEPYFYIKSKAQEKPTKTKRRLNLILNSLLAIFIK
jgi:hypothetical protein